MMLPSKTSWQVMVMGMGLKTHYEFCDCTNTLSPEAGQAWCRAAIPHGVAVLQGLVMPPRVAPRQVVVIPIPASTLTGAQRAELAAMTQEVVERPQLFCQANSFCGAPSFASPLLAVRSAAVSNSMPNILEKF